MKKAKGFSIERLPDKVAREKSPLLVFFHGAGGRGNDNEDSYWMLEDWLPSKKKRSEEKESHVFAGQVPKALAGSAWLEFARLRMPGFNSMKMAFNAMDAFIAEGRIRSTLSEFILGIPWVDMERGTIQRAALPQPFQFAVVEITLAKNLIQLPIWAWHGDRDSVIKPVRSREMIETITKAGGSPKYSEIKGRGHNSWVDCWNSQEMWDWLYSQTRR